MRIGLSRCALGLISVCLAFSDALAAARPREYQFDIPAQDLSVALKVYGVQANQQIVFSELIVRGRRSSAVSGRRTAEEALSLMMAGSDLSVSRTPTGVLWLAQTKSTQATRPTASTGAPKELPPDSAVSDANGQATLEEVVVTASRREENLQRESRQVSFVSGEELARNSVSDPSDVAALVPGLTVGKSGPQLQIYIRGVGDRSATAFGDPAVAPSLDGVYVPRSFALVGLFFDLDRVEVLKGPQGTLYGRNASAGALNMISAKPSMERLGGHLELEVGNENTRRVVGALTAPLGEHFAWRISGQSVDRDGYLSDDYSDEDNRSGRVQGLYRPNADLSVLFSTTYAHQGGKGPGPVIVPALDPDDPFIGAADPRSTAVFNAANPTNTLFRPGTDGYLDNDTWLASLTLDWAVLEGARLTVLPGYVYARNRSKSYVSGVPYIQDQLSKQGSLETRLASDGNTALEWVLGGYVAKEDSSDTVLFSTSRAVSIRRVFPQLDDLTWALFGEGKYHMTPRLRAIAGLRYTSEKKEVNGTSQTIIGGTPRPPGPIFGEQSWDALNFRAGAEYDLSERSMAYLTVSTGFKAGGFYGALPPNTYEPEKLTSYELGSKNRFLDDRLQLNVETFYWDYKDRQESFVGVVTGGATAFVTTNAGSATLYGADISLVGLATPRDRLSLDGEYLHSAYGRYVFQTNTTAARTGCIVGPSSDPRLTASVDCSGFQLVRAPQWSGRVAYQHTMPLGNRGSLLINAQTRFSAAYWLANDFLSDERADSYHVSDLILTYASPSGRLELSGFVRNIEDEGVYNLGVQSSGIDGFILAVMQPARTYGVKLRVTF